MLKFFIITIFSISSFCASAAIFGTDDRASLRPTSYQYRYGQSTAIGVLSSLIEPNPQKPGTYKMETDSLGDMMCKSERFSDLPSLSYACSGFLVAPDLLVTAGHCMVNQGVSENETGMYCEVYRWVFGYNLEKNSQVVLDQIPAKNYYSCKKIIYAILQDKPPYQDFALVQLDRPVEGHLPLPLNGKHMFEPERVHMVGYPMGLPMTYSGNAKIIQNIPTNESFLTDLDAFDGNSGSAVFNKKNEVIGILVAGTPANSFIPSVKNGNSCSIYNRCDQNGKNCTEDDIALNLSHGMFPRAGTRSTKFPRASSEVQKIQPIIDIMNKMSR